MQGGKLSEARNGEQTRMAGLNEDGPEVRLLPGVTTSASFRSHVTSVCLGQSDASSWPMALNGAIQLV